MTAIYINSAKVAQRYGMTRQQVSVAYRKRGTDFPQPIILPSGLPRWKITDLDQYDAMRET